MLANHLMLLLFVAFIGLTSSTTDITSFGFKTQDVSDAGSDSKYRVTLLWDGYMLTCNDDIKPTTRGTYYECTDFTVCDNPSENERTMVIDNYNNGNDWLSIDSISVNSNDVNVGDQGHYEWNSFCSPDSNLDFYRSTKDATSCSETNWDGQDEWNAVCMDNDRCLGTIEGAGGAENTWPKLTLSLSMIGEAGIIINDEPDLNCYDLCLVDETATYPTTCNSNSDCDETIGEKCNDRSISDGLWEELQDNDVCDDNCECYCISPQIISFGYQVSDAGDSAPSIDEFQVTLNWDGRNYECDSHLNGNTKNKWYECDSFTVCEDDSGSFTDRRMFIEKPADSDDGLWIETIRITDSVHGAIEYGTFCSDVNDPINPRYFNKANSQCLNGDDKWIGICMDEAHCLGAPSGSNIGGTTYGSGGAEKTYPIMELDLNSKEVQVVLDPDNEYQSICTYAVMDCGNKDNDYINNYRERIDWIKNDWFISGIYSEHNNNQEDRRWRGSYCRQSINPFISTSILPRTSEDATWDMQCDDNSALIGFTSEYNTGKRDRWFEFKCGVLDTTQYVLTECESSNGDYINGYDAIVDFKCPNNGIITGIRSTHSDHNEDRRYGFNCCRVTYPKCSSDDVGTFNWDELLKSGTNEPDMSYSIDIDEENLALDIVVKLRYLGYTSAAGNGALYGTTYVLDFEDFNAHNDEINKPGTCQNRDENAFKDASFNEYWNYSPEPLTAGNLGTINSLAYPPPKPIYGDWDISMDTDDGCGTVVYHGKFTWNDLKGCTSNGGGGNSYVTTKTNNIDNTLELSGTFYINVVSPYSHSTNMGGYYRVYQLLSAPFIISVAKTVYVLDNTGINLLRMSIIAVYKEDNENTFRLIVLSESANYLQLSRSNDLLSDFQSSSNNNQLTSGSFKAMQISASINYDNGEIKGCLNDKSNICAQLWEIKAENVNCNGNTQFVDFSGIYSIQFDVSCRTQQKGITTQLADYCDKWLNGDQNDLDNYPQHKSSITDQNGFVLLQTELTWKDEVCDPQIFNVHFGAEMIFYTDNEFDDNGNTAASDNYLYQVGQDTIYVEIITNFPGHFDVFDTILENVWICTFDPLITPDPISADTASGGCFDNNRDNTDFDGHIYELGPPQQKLFDFDNIGHPDNLDSSKNKIRFSFSVPSTITRDKIYIHAQIEVTLSNGNRRRMLLSSPSSTANQIDHFIGSIGIGNGENNNEPQQPQPQQPYNNYNEPQQPQPSTTWTVSLSSSWIIIIGSLLGLILIFNIAFMCYINCYKNKATRGGRVIFDNRLSGRGKKEYSSVKINDSEFDDSEINAINA